MPHLRKSHGNWGCVSVVKYVLSTYKVLYYQEKKANESGDNSEVIIYHGANVSLKVYMLET